MPKTRENFSDEKKKNEQTRTQAKKKPKKQTKQALNSFYHNLCSK